MKTCISIIIIFYFWTNSNGQSGFVFCSGECKNGQSSISFSLGQIADKPIFGPILDCNEGIQQSVIQTSYAEANILERPKDKTDPLFSIQEIWKFDGEEKICEDLTCSIVSISGKEIVNNCKLLQLFDFKLIDLPTGIYFILIRRNKEIIKSVAISNIGFTP